MSHQWKECDNCDEAVPYPRSLCGTCEAKLALDDLTRLSEDLGLYDGESTPVVELGNDECNAVAPKAEGDRAMCATDTSSARGRAENWQARSTTSALPRRSVDGGDV